MMKREMKKFATLLLCICMLTGGTVYAQEDDSGIAGNAAEEGQVQEEEAETIMGTEEADQPVILQEAGYSADAYYQDGKWVADLSSIIETGKEIIPGEDQSGTGGGSVAEGHYGHGIEHYDAATGKVTVKPFAPSIIFHVGTRKEGNYKEYVVKITYKKSGETIHTFEVSSNSGKFTADTSGIDLRAVYEACQVGADTAATRILVEECPPALGSQLDNTEYLKEYVKESGDTLESIYHVDMLFETSDKGREDLRWVKDNFGEINLSFGAGTENIGKTAAVYQLYDRDTYAGAEGEFIAYRNLTVDNNGTVTITASKLGRSAFAIVLQNLPFEDVAEGAWYQQAAEYVYARRIMTGMDDTHFGPGEKLSRSQFATILYRMEGTPEAAYNPGAFPDVAEGQFYTEAAMWTKESGVISGYEDGRFAPADEITREQMALMMFRYAKYLQQDTSKRGDLSGFPDMDRVSGFAREAVEWAVGEGLITGDQGRINPQGTAERGQCAMIIMRFMKR